MVSHEHIGMKSALLLIQRFVQPVQVSVIVFIAKETRFAIVSPLHDVQGYAIKMNTGTTGHE